MNSAVTVLLLFALLLEKSFAGYSTGFRRTSAPKDAVVRVIVYPTSHPVREDPLWKEHHGGSAGKVKEEGGEKIGDGRIDIDKNEGGKHEDLGAEFDIDIDKGEIGKIEDDRIDADDKKETKQEEEIPEKDLKEDVPLNEEKDVSQEFPDVPGKEELPVKLNDKSEEDEKHPHSQDQSLPKDTSINTEEELHPQVPDKESEPEKLPHPHSDNTKTILDDNAPVISDDGSHKISADSQLDEHVPVGVPGASPHDGSNYKEPDENVSPKIETNKESGIDVGSVPHPDLPSRDDFPGAGAELLEPNPVDVGDENTNINLYELMDRLELSRFLHLVEEANLKDMLTGEGPVTIFAPSDYALSKLSADTIRKLATNQELLRQFVLYHCVDGQIYGTSLEERDNSILNTKLDNAVHINEYRDGWFVNGIPITAKDQICTNGVIHILDYPLYPFPTGDLMDTLEKTEDFTIYAELIRNAKLDKELKGDVSYTVFAPTDVAFAQLPPASLEWLKWDIPAIKRMFRQLTVRGTYYTTWVPSTGGQLSSIDGETSLSLSSSSGSIKVNGVELRQHDITANNGCIHGINDIWFLAELATPSRSNQKKEHHA